MLLSKADMMEEERQMLCIGSTMGSRKGILHYFDVMIEEFEYWKTHDECRFDMVGDNQSIHNYVFYSNKTIGGTVSVPHWTGPIHVIGTEANFIYQAAKKEAVRLNLITEEESGGYINSRGFLEGEHEWWDWLGQDDLVDPDTGAILNLDGNQSPQVRQFDRFGPYFNKYLNRML